MVRLGSLPVAGALYLLLSLLWSWPLCLDPLGLDLSLPQGGGGTLAWTRDLRLEGFDLRSALLAWPQGCSALQGGHLLGPLLGLFLGQLPPVALHAGLTLLGPPISALAADWLAREMGARPPWSLLAGLAFGFSGVTAMAFLQGDALEALNPWLPLTLGLAARALRPGANARNAWLAGLCFLISLGVGPGLALGATLLLFALLVGQILRDRAEILHRPPTWILLGFLLPGVAWMLSRATGGLSASAPVVEANLEFHSARLSTLLWRMPSLDLALGGQGALLGSVAFVLACFTPLLGDATRPAGIRRLGLGALLLVLLAFGPWLRLYGFERGISWVMRTPAIPQVAWDTLTPEPVRLLQPVGLVLGLAGAVVLSACAAHSRLRASLLLGAAFLEVLALGSPALRGGARPRAVASAFAAAPVGLAVLELWPASPGPDGGSDAILAARAAEAAQRHGHPIASELRPTPGVEEPREILSRWLLARVEAGDSPEETQARLSDLGFGAIALHASLFPPSTIQSLREALGRHCGSPAAESVDAGSHVLLWRIADVSGVRRDVTLPSPEDRKRAWASMLEASP